MYLVDDGDSDLISGIVELQAMLAVRADEHAAGGTGFGNVLESYSVNELALPSAKEPVALAVA
jgi:hypothetical protein